MTTPQGVVLFLIGKFHDLFLFLQNQKTATLSALTGALSIKSFAVEHTVGKNRCYKEGKRTSYAP